MLTKIRAQNFKSLRSATLDLGPRNVLVGANMAGKSNVIDLFRFIYDTTFPRQPGSGALSNAVFARGGFSELLWKAGNEQVLEVALSGTTLAHGQEGLIVEGAYDSAVYDALIRRLAVPTLTSGPWFAGERPI